MLFGYMDPWGTGLRIPGLEIWGVGVSVELGAVLEPGDAMRLFEVGVR